MPRTLPWLTQKANASDKSTSTDRPVKRQRAQTPDLVDEDLNTTGVSTPERRAKLRRPPRTPSTSPPPAPPDVDYMREGYAADDIWRMVEDEFLSTAKLYTQHLHHAEYVRLKRLAKSRSPTAIQSIIRPTDGRTAQTTELKLRHEADANARNIKAGMRRVTNHHDSDEGDDEPWMHDPQLAGLMGSEARSGQLLTGVAKAKSATRAAAGFNQDRPAHGKDPVAKIDRSSVAPKVRTTTMYGHDSHSSARADDDDDLDAPPKTAQGRVLPVAERRPQASRAEERKTETTAAESRVTSYADRRYNGSEVRKTNDEDSIAQRYLGKLDAFPTMRVADASHLTAHESSGTSGFMAKRKALREKRAKERERERQQPIKKEDDVDAIPTFLF